MRLAKWLIAFAGLFLMANSVLPTNAMNDNNTSDNKPYIALGADLTPEQRSVVLNLMGVSEEELQNYSVVTITNAEEHQYLDAYLSNSLIGTKSLSSVLVRKADKGHGVVVTTKNINYCTTGMYRNALLTAGVEDAEILVVGPSQISGTAGLIGAIRAYENMSGIQVSDSVMDIALNELVATSEIAADSLYSDEIEELIAYIKAKLAAGELDGEEEIKAAIEEGETKFGVSLTDAEKEKIIGVMDKINKLGLDPETLLNQAKDLYAKYGNDLLENPERAIGEIIKNTVSNFFEKIGSGIKNFFSNLFR